MHNLIAFCSPNTNAAIVSIKVDSLLFYLRYCKNDYNFAGGDCKIETNRFRNSFNNLKKYQPIGKFRDSFWNVCLVTSL